MKILITFRDGTKLSFDQSTVVGFKCTDRVLYILTNSEKTLYIYNMSIVDAVKTEAVKGSILDYILKDF